MYKHYEERRYDSAGDLYVPVTKLKLALNPWRVAAAGTATGLRDVRVTCKLADEELINIGGCLSAQ